MPRSPMFPRLFGRSPIAKLQTHMEKAAECASELKGFFEVVFQGDWDKALLVNDKICRLEEEADIEKRELRIHLPRSLFLPVSRSDLLELIRVQDKIPNRIKDVAGIVTGRRMQIPESLQHKILTYVSTSVAAVYSTRSLLEEFDELLESGFSNREMDQMDTMISELGEQEHLSDEQQVEIRRNLFDLERDLHAVDIMFLYRVIDLIGEVADHAQTVGNRMLYVIAR